MLMSIQGKQEHAREGRQRHCPRTDHEQVSVSCTTHRMRTDEHKSNEHRYPPDEVRKPTPIRRPHCQHRTSLQSMILNNIQGSVSGLDTTLQQIQLDTTGLQGASADLQRISQAISQLSRYCLLAHLACMNNICKHGQRDPQPTRSPGNGFCYPPRASC